MTRHTLRAVGATALTCVLGLAQSALAAAPQPWELGLQPAASPVKHALDDFHNLLLVIITAITLLVFALLVAVAVRFNAKRNPTPSSTSHNTLLEVAWTVVPVIILIVIAVPSFRVLYMMEVTPEAEMTIKVTGRQWYWDYEYPDQGGFAYSSYMIQEADLKPGQKRLLEVDNRVVVPVNTVVRVQLTAGDVIHAWALPAFGVKKDAVPGRLNETWFKVEKEGVYYGQCSEICGTNHGFMPIAVEAMSKEKFAEWVAKAKVAYGTPDGSRELAQMPAAAETR
ncbi:cytochrome c oxidase subunit II [Azospirillum sp. TSO22-1]|uniref:cytochrome c oxidase subunit II n=1 Tax=Azospirillum sp. TSO22-1 TaxID=716789 RepID=UPI000D622BE7|nr:cytochrome c oxidase subunit II [Azospirillum sp. TSO22-1]PWC56369.1 cytochrome C oxidase subunit II [Azospirillum sp. TSO22-1]